LSRPVDCSRKRRTHPSVSEAIPAAAISGGATNRRAERPDRRFVERRSRVNHHAVAIQNQRRQAYFNASDALRR
jgi:hypothetical protein